MIFLVDYMKDYELLYVSLYTSIKQLNYGERNSNTFQSARNFYRMYPQIIENFQTNKSASMLCKSYTDTTNKISSTESIDNQSNEICPTESCKFQTSGKAIISKLSYSHIYEIMKVSDPLARYFYEQECIKCTWSVRELRRQISTNLKPDEPKLR